VLLIRHVTTDAFVAAGTPLTQYNTWPFLSKELLHQFPKRIKLEKQTSGKGSLITTK
jgi:hypothetical protein